MKSDKNLHKIGEEPVMLCCQIEVITTFFVKILFSFIKLNALNYFMTNSFGKLLYSVVL